MTSLQYNRVDGLSQQDETAPGSDDRRSARWSERTARNCNICSAVCSFAAFVTVCVMAGVRPDAKTNLWVDSMVSIDNTNVTGLVQAELFQQCGNRSGKYEMQVAEYRFNDTQAFMLPVPLRVGTVSVWPFVGVVFAVSFIFQALNAYRADVDGDGDGDNDGDNDGDGGSGAQRGRGPDYARWAEYALTSPFQIFAVATSFFVGERDLLLCIMFLQGLLVLMGYGIELELRDAIEAIRSGTETLAARQLLRALGLVVYAVAAHCIVWGVLVGRFQDIVQNVSNCQETHNMPIGLIGTLLGGQCFLFSLFGVVAIFQLGWLARRVYGNDCARIREKNFSREFWLQTTIIYCGLSCLAKTFLALLIVMVQVAMPREQR
jgi:hypothetical protein